MESKKTQYNLLYIRPLIIIIYMVCFSYYTYSQKFTEYEVKSAYIFNFTKFVQWQESSFNSTNSPYIIGIYKNTSFGLVLSKTIEDRTVHGRKFIIKYINSPETSIYKKGETIFGIHTAVKEIRRKKEFVLVEGNFDVLAFYQSGVRNVVAPLGTAFTEKQAKYLKRYASRCLMIFDSDMAGIEATLKSAVILEKYGITNYVISLPKGKDPSEILEKEGPEALNKLTKYPINTFEYLVKRAIERFGIKNTEGKESVFQFVTPYLASLGTELRKEDSFRYLANVLEIDVNAVFKDYAARKKQTSPVKIKNPVQDQQKEITVSLDLFLMIALVENREAFASFRNVIDLDDLDDSRAKRVYVVLEDMYRRSDSSNEGLMSKIDDEKLKDVILHKLSTGEYRINSEQIIKDGVNKIRQRNLEKKRSEIEMQLRKIGLTTDRFELENLLSEKKFIDEELLRIKGN